jgi:hypothetical protein
MRSCLRHCWQRRSTAAPPASAEQGSQALALLAQLHALNQHQEQQLCKGAAVPRQLTSLASSAAQYLGCQAAPNALCQLAWTPQQPAANTRTVRRRLLLLLLRGCSLVVTWHSSGPGATGSCSRGWRLSVRRWQKWLWPTGEQQLRQNWKRAGG